MKAYKKIYCKAFGYDYNDKTAYIPSEISGEPAVDIHHIATREDRIENLMAVTRIEHKDFGEIKKYMPYLLKIHMRQLQLNNIEFDPKWFEFYIKKYEGLNE
tara:strand:+ start:2866 stop:3171 length:306 start_codon:yes stop_codon:yes gene_type:complete